LKPPILNFEVKEKAQKPLLLVEIGTIPIELIISMMELH
jgi:hypothetical protein